MFESEVTIRDPQAAIGTFVFTALDYTSDDAADLRWTALAMYPDPTDPGRHRAGMAAAAAASPEPPMARRPKPRWNASPFHRTPSTAFGKWLRRAPR